MKPLRIGIAGAGIGGLSAALALQKQGHDITVFEQAKGFFRVGADINLTPNAVLALDGLGVGVEARKTAARPTHRISRMWDTGEETSRLAMSNEAEEKYGAPQLTLHRADLLSALASDFDVTKVLFNKRIEHIKEENDQVVVQCADNSEYTFDAFIGADGIHSAVRTALWGQEAPQFTGLVAFRAVIPADRVKDVPNIQAFTKWWGPNPQSQIVTFPLNEGKDVFIFATIGQDTWHLESWTTQGNVEELVELYADYHEDARALLEACDEVLKTALYERDPMPNWGQSRCTLLGDAAHPMLPFMAQGAGMAIEDAVVLGRAFELVENAEDIPAALQAYEMARKERTAAIQIGSRGNNWLKDGGNCDWVYGYNAWATPIAVNE